MTEALIGTCILAITTVIFVWVCSEYQIYNNEHSAEEKLNYADKIVSISQLFV